MIGGNPLAEKMLAQRVEIRRLNGQVTHLTGEVERSEQTVRNLQHELDLAHRQIAELRSK
jgi:chromosome segregation ATPase